MSQIDTTHSSRDMPEQSGDKQNASTSGATSPAKPVISSRLPEYTPGWFSRFIQRCEKRLSELSTKNNFWHRVCTYIFLPLAFRSGIRFTKGDASTFSVVLPFRKFNRNWYNAMAGGALLGNAEVAGGMYLFKFVGADYTVVCKHLEFDFRRPCMGPAVYRIDTKEDVPKLMEENEEFNVTVEMAVLQMVSETDKKERRVGKCQATYHVAPKARFRQRKFKLKLLKKAQQGGG